MVVVVAPDDLRAAKNAAFKNYLRNIFRDENHFNSI